MAVGFYSWDQLNDQYPHLLQSMHRQRYLVFVRCLGWDLDCPMGYEEDQFDGPGAIYGLRLNGKGKLTGAIRLLPSNRPHVLGDLFPHLCEGGVPIGQKIYEVSRIYSKRIRVGGAPYERTVGELVVGMIEFGLTRDIKAITTLVRMTAFPDILFAGWDVEPLGLPREVDGEQVLACKINVTSNSLKAIRCWMDVAEDSVLINPSEVMAA